MKKILTDNQIAQTVKKLKRKKKKISLCHGVFDIFHFGHLKHFQIAKSYSDILIVSLTSDKFVNKGKNRPIFDEDKRLKLLASLEIIDYVFISNNRSAINSINKIKPDFYFKGIEFKYSDTTGKIGPEIKATKINGGKIIYTDDITFSSSKLINENNYSDDQLKFIRSSLKKSPFQKTLAHIEKLRKLKVMIIGETIIDEYNFCEVLGKSGKEPYLAIKPKKIETYLGGAAAIANHISDFVRNINLVTHIGTKNEYKDFIKSKLKQNIKTNLFKKYNSPTIVKKRYLDHISGNKLIGVYTLNDDIDQNKKNSSLQRYIKKNINNYDLIIVSDYGHGFITDSVISAISNTKKFVSLNAQVNAANVGYHTIKKYKNINLAIINENELRHEMRNKNEDLKKLAKRLMTKINTKKLIVTRGRNGALMFQNNKVTHCPAFANQVIDKVGAGDTMLSLLSLCIKEKMEPEIALLIGSFAGAFSVESVGNSTFINKKEFIRHLEFALK